MPRDSRYVEALADDEQLAEQLLAQPRDDTTPRRRVSDWSVQVELLTSILNRLGEVCQAIAALGGAKPHKVAPAPAPHTAIDRVRVRHRFAKHQALAARVLAKRSD